MAPRPEYGVGSGLRVFAGIFSPQIFMIQRREMGKEGDGVLTRVGV